MRTIKSAILDLNKQDRQDLWDALHHYYRWLNEMKNTDHCAKDVFAETADRLENGLMRQMWDTWDDIMH